MTDSPSSADQPAEPVGAILARWRKRKRITGQALGEQVGMSQAKISRLETGAVAAEPGDVRRLAEALEMPAAEVDRLVDQAEHADNQLTDWTTTGVDLAAFQHQIGQIEAAAKELRVFQPAVVPGLMQTSEYARAIMSDLTESEARLAESAVALSEAVNARMQRNHILLLPDRQFHFLITEQVLRNRVCRPAEMIGQIDRMREVAKYPNVRLSIIPQDAQLPVAPYHGFQIADERWVSVDLFNTSLRSSGRKTVRAYRSVFDHLERVALTEVDDLLDHYQTVYVRQMLPRSVAN
jgi:transcriptional regulator with XRE-family HTH domain